MAHKKGMKIRVRCPLCGMLVWQSRLNKDYTFEFVIQESAGRGYQRIENKYKPARKADTVGARMFQTVLALKMIEKAEDLLNEADAGIEIDVRMPEEAKEEFAESYEEATAEVEYEAEEVKAEEVERETEEYVFEVDGREYEIEVPALQVKDVKPSFFKRLRRKSREIEDMESIKELEIGYDVKDVEYEVESFAKVLRGGR